MEGITMKKFFLLSLLTLFIFFTVIPASNVQNMNMVGKFPIGYCKAVASQGNYLAVSSGYGVRLLNISDPANPQHISSVATPGEVADIFWQNNYLYLALQGNGSWAPPGTAGLVIVDVSNVSAPYKVTFLETNEGAFGVAVKDNVLFLAVSSTLYSYDISNPANPQQLQQFYLGSVTYLFLRSNLLFAAAQSGGTHIYDVSNPTSIQEISRIAVYSPNVFATADRLFLPGSNQNEILMYDISVPSSPALMDTIFLPAAEWYNTMAEYNGKVFVVSRTDTVPYGTAILHLRSLDISDPTNPTVLDHIQHETDSYDVARIVITTSGEAVVAHKRGASVINVSNPISLSYSAYHKTWVELKQIVKQDHYLFLSYLTARYKIGFFILDIRNVAMPLLTSDYLIAYKNGGGIPQMAVFGNSVYISHDQSYGDSATARGITVVDVSDVYHPGNEQFIATYFPSTAISVDSSHIYLAHIDTVCALNKNTIAFDYKLPLGWGHQITHFSQLGDTLVVGTHNSVHLVNLPTATEMGSYLLNMDHFYDVKGTDISGNYLFVATSGDSGFLVLDISDPHQIQKVSAMYYGQNTDVRVSGKYAYVANGYLGVRMIDISNIRQPQEIGYYQTERGQAIKFVMNGQFICAAYLDVMIFENTFISDVASPAPEFPVNFELKPNYPNPFNPETTIPFSVAQSGRVRLTVYNTLGEVVQVLVDGYLPAGEYRIPFRGNGLASGTYLYELKEGEHRLVRSMLLLK